MSVYVVCPKYIAARAPEVAGDLCHIFFRHFLADTKCRIAVDKSGVKLGYLVSCAGENDVMRGVIDFLSNNACIADRAIELLPVDEPKLSVEEIVPLLLECLSSERKLLCYQKSDYSYTEEYPLIDRAEIKAFMENDCKEINVGDKPSIKVGNIQAQNVAVGGEIRNNSNSMSVVSERYEKSYDDVISEIESILLKIHEQTEVESEVIEPVLVATRKAQVVRDKTLDESIGMGLKNIESALERVGSASDHIEKISSLYEKLGNLIG
ncbi:hypothetical protein [Hyphococcus sp.]|uniref:hypothetical protein n=1 Tax=Hyphococcus sp. TaxID=2038636 RepID=UPI003CCC4214